MEKPAESQLHRTASPIAIIGMSALYPDAPSLKAYWENIIEKKDCIRDIPDEYWSIQDHFSPDPMEKDKTYSRRAGVLPVVDFDPIEFGIPPKFIDSISTVQLLSLISARDLLIDAGYWGKKAKPLDSAKTGVIIGGGIGSKILPLSVRLEEPPVLRKILRSFGVAEALSEKIINRFKDVHHSWTKESFPGLLANVISGRIANRFNLNGTNCTVDAACASGMAAMNIAINDLVLGDSNMVITGGVNFDLTIFSFVCFSKTPALSITNTSKPYAAGSDGIVLGDGVGMLLLKRLEDAVRDQDKIYAVIKGIGASADGKSKSIYAPHLDGQVLAIKRAYAKTGIRPRDITLIEGHGTGTTAGDTCEVEALKKIYQADEVPPASVALGSVKSQIGHTRMSAGAASMIKTALALYHQVLPPMINAEEPNPKLGLQDSPFYLINDAQPWFQELAGQKRTAAVSAFGFGGTNYHAILEEYREGSRDEEGKNNFMPGILLSAENEKGLLQKCRELFDAAQRCEREDQYQRLLRAPQAGQPAPEHARLGFVADSKEDFLKLLKSSMDRLEQHAGEEWHLPGGVYFRKKGISPEAKVVALFPGQGSQYENMGKAIALRCRTFIEWFDHMDRARSQHNLGSVSGIIFPSQLSANQDQADRRAQMAQTNNAQAAIGCFSAAVYTIFKSWGFSPDYMIGHSYGELVALWAAGCINNETFIQLTLARGEALQHSGDKGSGGMLAVFSDEDTVRETLLPFPETFLVNYNSQKQVVLSGPISQIQKLQALFREKGCKAVMLAVANAFHSPLVQSALEPFRQALNQAGFTGSSVPVFSNLKADHYPQEPERIKEILAQQMISPVLFRQSVEKARQDGGTVFVEFGPQNILTNLVGKILEGQPIHTVAVNPGPKNDAFVGLNQALLQLQVLGLPLANPQPVLDYSQNNKKSNQHLVTPLEGIYYSLTKDGKKSLDEITAVPQENRLQNNPLESPPAARTVIKAEEAPGIAAEDLLKNQHLVSEIQGQFMALSSRHAEIMHELIQQSTVLMNRSQRTPGEEMKLNVVLDHLDKLQNNHQQAISIQYDYLQTQMAYLSGMTGQALPAMSALSPETKVASLDLGSAVARTSAPSSPGMPGTMDAGKQGLVPDVPPAVPAKASSAMAGSPLDTEAVKKSVLQIIADKTGYPEDVLDLDMDMEADLGIDSIKRVEIFAGISDLGVLSTAGGRDEPQGVDMEALVGLKTLRDVIAFIEQKARSLKNIPENKSQVMTAALPAAAMPTPAPAGSPLDTEAVKKSVLQIIADKTGYPEDVLDLDMDMEADLGIDSIKRVEIFAGISDLGVLSTAGGRDEPQGVDMEALVGLKTLRDVIAFIEQKARLQEDQSPGTAGGKVHPMERSGHPGQNEPKARHAIKRYNIEPKALSAPVMIPVQGMNTEGSWLVVSEPSPLAAAVIEELKDRGISVVPLEMGGQGKYKLTSGAEDEVVAMLKTIAGQEKPVCGILYVNPFYDAEALDSLFLQKEENYVTSLFFIAKHLYAQMTSQNQGKRTLFAIITQFDGNLGIGKNRLYPVISSGLYGLAKSLRWEWPSVFFRIIDLSPDIARDKMGAMVWAELLDEDKHTIEVGLDQQGRRTTLSYTEDTSTACEAADDLPDENSVFLVSGGGRGITAHCVIGLARQYKSTFILTGRTALAGTEEAWCAGCDDEEELKQRALDMLKAEGTRVTPVKIRDKVAAVKIQKEIKRTMNSIKKAGGKVYYLNINITDSRGLKQALAGLSGLTRPITGIIHAAGNLSDKKIEKKEIHDINRVFKTKVKGLEALIQSVNVGDLKHMIVFSSVAGFFGNAGQTDYAAANEVLNKYVYNFSKQYPRCKAVAINWGPWDSGMVTPDLKKLYQAHHLEIIPSDIGADFFVKELGCGKHGNQVIICGENLMVGVN